MRQQCCDVHCVAEEMAELGEEVPDEELLLASTDMPPGDQQQPPSPPDDREHMPSPKVSLRPDHPPLPPPPPPPETPKAKGSKRERKGDAAQAATASESLLSVVRFDSDVDATREASHAVLREKEELVARKADSKGPRSKKKHTSVTAAVAALYYHGEDTKSTASLAIAGDESDFIFPVRGNSHPMLHRENQDVHIVSYGCDNMSSSFFCVVVSSFNSSSIHYHFDHGVLPAIRYYVSSLDVGLRVLYK